MANKSNKVNEAKTCNVSSGTGQVEYCTKKFSYYLYQQVEKLWAEIIVLQQENNKLRSKIQGA